MILSADAYCRSCGLNNNSNCMLWGKPIDPNKDFCSRHQRGLQLCGHCHRPMLYTEGFLIPKGEEIEVVCSNCYNNIKLEVSQ